MLSQREAFARTIEAIIADDSHGYSQPNRAGDGTTCTYDLGDGVTVHVHGGDTDCSETERMGLAAVGVDVGGFMWTGNEDEILTRCGFIRHTLATSDYRPRRGDVLLRSGHTETMLSDDTCGGARSSREGNGITGEKGDQSGTEVESGAFTRSRWTWAYEWPSGDGLMIGDDDMPQPSDMWNYGLANDPSKQGQDNVRAGDMLGWAHHDGAEVRKAVIAGYDSPTNDGTSGGLADRICYIDQRVREDHETISAMSALLSKVAAKVGAE